MNVRDVRMVQRGECLGLACETRQPLRVGREEIGQDFERDTTIELCVSSAIHLPHAAFADLRGDFIDAEASTEAEGQTLLDYTVGRDIGDPTKTSTSICHDSSACTSR